MKKFLFTFYLSIIFSVNFSYSQNELNNSTLIVNEVNRISQNIRCLVCRNQSIESSNSEFALDIKKMINKKLLEGKKEDEIFQYLKSKYGDYILFDPPLQFNTLILWGLPFLCLLFGITIFAFKYIKIRRK